MICAYCNTGASYYRFVSAEFHGVRIYLHANGPKDCVNGWIWGNA
jgi:hypothetical protein